MANPTVAAKDLVRRAIEYFASHPNSTNVTLCVHRQLDIFDLAYIAEQFGAGAGARMQDDGHVRIKRPIPEKGGAA